MPGVTHSMHAKHRSLKRRSPDTRVKSFVSGSRFSNMTGKQSKKKEDLGFECEEQFILRLPVNVAGDIKQELRSGVPNLKERLRIDVNPETRRGKVIYNGRIFNAKLVDLPCIIESHKTTDRKTLYKTADISQMLVCVSDDEDAEDCVLGQGEKKGEKKKKDEDKKHQWNHGIAPPLKNVRKRRFRKTMAKKNPDLPDVDKEVRRLLEQDAQAVSVSYEVIYESKSPVGRGEVQEDSLLLEEETNNEDNKMMEFNDTNVFSSHKLFGDVSSSDEEDVNVIDSADEFPSSSGGVGLGVSRVTPLTDFLGNEQPGSNEPDMSELQSKRHEVTEELKELRDRRMAKENFMAIAENDNSNDSLQTELQSIMEEETKKQNELCILNSMLNST